MIKLRVSYVYSSRCHEIERDFLTSQKISDWIHGRGTIPVRLGDGRKVKAEMFRDPERNYIQIDILTPRLASAFLRNAYR